jgi:hypothetical protein
VQTPTGQGPFRGLSWAELLQGLLETIPEGQRNELLVNLRRRVAYSGRLRKGFEVEDLKMDRLLIAWFIGRAFPTVEARNEAIFRLVEPPGESDLKAVCQSDLHDELLTLPFDDIVTTNYDHHIARFLKTRQKPIEYVDITDSRDLARASAGNGAVPRLFYLHGKAGPEARLVFDRFDYAALLAERDGIVDYVTYLLRDAHVIYVGFGLDDQTFNLMETRLQQLQGVHRPQSFAFIPVVTEKEREEWQRRNLDIIDYGIEHKVLPEMLRCVNTIRRFVLWAEPARPARAERAVDRAEDYTKLAVNQYVAGDFINSLLNCRAALAATLFWDKEVVRGSERKTLLPLDKAVRLCEIRIRLALNHYKLCFAPAHELWRTHSIKPREALELNLRAAQAIVKEARTIPKGTQLGRRNQLLGLDKSLKVLEARIAYHKGDFKRALRIYSEVVTDQTERAFKRDRYDDRSAVISKLRLAEAFYYAKCQISRIEYQFLDRSRKSRTEERQRQVSLLTSLADSMERIRAYIDQREDTCGHLPEWAYFRHSIATIHCIAMWTAGRHAVRICQDVLPIIAERTRENLGRLDEGVALLEKNPAQNLEVKWRPPSSRWRALRYRYLARALGLKWVIRCSESGAGTMRDDDLIRAYEWIQKAIEEAKGPGLERQRIVNFLEAARLNVFALFGERIRRTKPGAVDGASPLTLAAGVYYLEIAFTEIDKAAKEKVDVTWLRVLGFRLASYFAIVSGVPRGELARRVTNKDLAQFFKLTLDQMVKRVIDGYREFGRKISDRTALARRIQYYESSLKTIRAELAQLKKTTDKLQAPY